MKRILFLVVIFIILTTCCFSQKNEDIEVNQISVPVVTFTNPQLISFFLDEFFIPETLVTKLEIIDVNLNGFSENDIVKLYPSDNVYFLQYVSDKAQNRMNEWKFKANFQIAAQNKELILSEDYQSNKPAYNIFGAILRGLNKNYQDFPIKIHFERDSATVLFELWSYNEKLLKVIPDPVTRLNDSLLSQISTVCDSTIYDCIFIYKTMIDTVFVKSLPPEPEKKLSNF